MNTLENNLTAKQQRFSDEWLIDHNGCRAYKAAYKNVKKDSTAAAAASRLLINVNVSAYIKMRQAEIAFKYKITQSRIIKEESYLAYSNIAEIVKGRTVLSPDQLPERVQRAISSMEVIEDTRTGQTRYKYKLHDKGSALGRVEKILGMNEKDNAQQRASKLKEVFNALSEVSKPLADAVMEKLRAATNSPTSF